MTNYKAYTYLLLATIFWAGNYIMGKILSDSINPISLAFLRLVFSVILLLPFSYKQVKSHYKIIMENKLMIISLGFFGTYMFQVSLYSAVKSASVLSTSLMLAFCPTLVALLNHILKVKSLNFRTLFYCLLSAFGIIIILTKGDIVLLLQLKFTSGNLWGLLSVMIWAFYSILIVRVTKQIPAMALLFSQMTVGLIFAFITMNIFEYGNLTNINPNYEFVLPLIYIVLGPSILSFYFYNQGAKQVGGLIAAAFVNLIPLFAVAMSILFLGEKLYPHHIISAILLFISLHKLTRV